MGIFSGLMKSIGYIKYSNVSNYYQILQNNTNYLNGVDKLELSRNNSTLASVISIRADYLSKVKFYVENSNGDKIFDDPSLEFIKNPNPYQSTEDFLIQFEWFLCAYGWVYQRPYMSVTNNTPRYMYNLNSGQITFSDSMPDSIIITKAQENKYLNSEFEYADTNTTKNIKFRDIIPYFDVANSINNQLQYSTVTSPSRLDSIIKETSNVSLASDAENVVIQTNGREMIFNDNTGGAIPDSGIPLAEDDRKNIAKILNRPMTFGGKRTLTPSKKLGWVNMSVKLSDLGLNESRETNSNIIAQRFQVPNEIYKAFTKGDTFENQKQAELKFIQNVIQPRANDIASSWTNAFGDENRPFKASFDHLPTMQVAEEIRAEKALKISTTIRNLVQGAGLSEEQAMDFVSNMGIQLEK